MEDWKCKLSMNKHHYLSVLADSRVSSADRSGCARPECRDLFLLEMGTKRNGCLALANRAKGPISVRPPLVYPAAVQMWCVWKTVFVCFHCFYHTCVIIVLDSQTLSYGASASCDGIRTSNHRSVFHENPPLLITFIDVKISHFCNKDVIHKDWIQSGGSQRLLVAYNDIAADLSI